MFLVGWKLAIYTLLLPTASILSIAGATEIPNLPTPNSTIQNASVQNTSVLLVIPGHGGLKRWNLLQLSIRALRKSVKNSFQNFKCEIYSYNPTYTPQLKSKKLCTIVENRGYWTHHMSKVNATGYSHIAVMMDDVNATRVNLPRAIRTMNRFGFDVASAGMEQWHYSHMNPHPSCLGHAVNFVDVLFTIFTAHMWDCWVRQIDLDVNPIGWGYDLTMRDLCHSKAGVLDKEIARHGHGKLPGDAVFGAKSRSYDTKAAVQQLRQWVGKVYGITNSTLQDETVILLQKNKYPTGRLICME